MRTYYLIKMVLGRKVFQKAFCSIKSKNYSKKYEVNKIIEKVRNVGVMAHVDAGKTTTTERMLYYAGFLSRMGNVDDGNTTMDYLKQEQERGITINAAAITFPWREFQLNLIDTPGHIDFTFEVERSTRVLDGAVVVIDGSKGVESQTISVWRQADRYKVPRIMFMNKMDQPKANHETSLDSIRNKLKIDPLLIQLPIKIGEHFSGIIDLVGMNVLLWEPDADDGSHYWTRPLVCNQSGSGQSLKSAFVRDNVEELKLSPKWLEQVFDYRTQLIDQLAMTNDVLFEMVLSESYSPLKLDERVLKAGIRSAVLQFQCVPVLCGSALKNKGIQPLLDSVVDYLPSPHDMALAVPDVLKDLFAFAFKVTHDPQRGPLVYMRIYSGSIRPQSTVYNMTRKKTERITRVLLMLADEQKEMQVMTQGNIAVAVGMKHTVTGDSLVPSAGIANELSSQCSEEQLEVLRGPVVPEPMFFCTIEPPSAAYQADLDHALACLTREDPSLNVIHNEETGQKVLTGMGDLHLDIVLNRIRDEYKVDATLGKLQVAYREAPSTIAVINESFSSTHGGSMHSMNVSLTLSPSTKLQPEIVFPFDRDISFPTSSMSRSDLMQAITNGINTAVLRGPLLSFPVSQLRVAMDSLTVNPGTSLAWVSNTISMCVSKALSKTDIILLEPFVELEVLVTEDHLQTVLGDLTNERGGVVESVEDQQEVKRVSAIFPVASLSGYSAALRTLTSGMASFGSQFSHYGPVTEHRTKSVYEQLMGHSLL